MSQKNYPGMFNLTKGLMMIAIMMMHAVTDGLFGYGLNVESKKLFLLQFFAYGSMAMFFMLCGYTAKKKSWKVCMRAQKAIIRPYCTVAGAVLAVSLVSVFVVHGHGSDYFSAIQYNFFPYLLGLSAGTFMGIPVHGIGAIWFFVVYVLDSIILNALLRIKKVWAQIGILIVMAFVGVRIGTGILIPFYLPQALIGAGYMYAGMWCKKLDIFNREIPKWVWMLLMSGWFFMSVNGNINMADNYWKCGMADWLMSFGAGLCLLVGLQSLNYLEGRISEKIRWIGRHAMWICCIHSVSQIAIPWNQILKKISSQPAVGMMVEFILYFVLAVGGCYLLEGIKRRQRKKHKKKRVQEMV